MADLSFETVNDTDINELDAIQPIELGEDANPTNWNRPTDRLRERTERARIGVNENAYLNDESSWMTISTGSSTTIQWDGAWDGLGTPPAKGSSGSGYFDASGSFVVVPFISSGTAATGSDREDSEIWGSGAGYHSVYAWMDADDATNYIRIISEVFSHEGGDWIDFEVIQASTNLTSPIVEVFGEPPLSGGDGFAPWRAHVRVTISDGSSNVTSIQDVINAVAGDAVASARIRIIDNPVTPSSDLNDPMFTVTKTRLTRGLNAVTFQITQANLETAFNNNNKRLQEGDCLAIQFADLATRRGSIIEKGAITVPAASIVNLSYQPEEAAGAVPICRVLNGDLVFINGVVIPEYVSGETVPRLLPHASNVKIPALSQTYTPLTKTNLEDQIAEISDYLEDIYDGNFSFERLGINQNPPNGSTRLHITDTGQGAAVRLERTNTTVVATDEYGDIHAYGNDTGGTGVRAQMLFVASGPDGETDVVFKAADAGATLAESLRVANAGVLVTGVLQSTGDMTVQAGSALFVNEIDRASGTQLDLSVDTYVDGRLVANNGLSNLGTASTGTNITIGDGVNENYFRFEDLQTTLALNDVIGQFEFETNDSGFEGVTGRILGYASGTQGSMALSVQLRESGGTGNADTSNEVFKIWPQTNAGRANFGFNRTTGTSILNVGKPTASTPGNYHRMLEEVLTFNNLAASNDGMRHEYTLVDTTYTIPLAREDVVLIDASNPTQKSGIKWSAIDSGVSSMQEVMLLDGKGSLRVGNNLVSDANVPYLDDLETASAKVAGAFTRDDNLDTNAIGTAVILANRNAASASRNASSLVYTGRTTAGDFEMGRVTSFRETVGGTATDTLVRVSVNSGAGNAVDTSFDFKASGEFIPPALTCTGSVKLGSAGNDVEIGLSPTAGIGFYNASPVTRQDVTGSKGGNVALGNLLTALATLGLITDSTT